ncbi:unnamed protein product, partial [Vitis vinifera]
MAFVGEAFLSASIQKLVDMLACPDLRKFAREEQVHAELKKWEGILLKIHAVLHDAEEKQMTNRFVQIWLAELRDLAYDVEDILDDFATEALRRNLIKDDPQPSTSTVRSLISSLSSRFNPNALVYNLNMGSKIEEITARLHEISTQKGDLDLRENVEGRSHRKRKRVPETASLVVESRVYGRETDKEAILESLTLKNCGKCTSLPCLGRLSLLKALRIQGMCKVKTIGDEFFGEVSLFQPFPCLEECPKLTGSLPNCLPSLAELEIFECPKLKAALPRLAYVCSLNVVECNEVVLRNGVDLSSLTTLNIQRISRLTCLREGFTQLLAALQKLVIRGCGEMTSLWENRFGLECLRGLESIDIWQCHGLVSLEEQRLPCNLKHLKIENCANLQRLMRFGPQPYFALNQRLSVAESSLNQSLVTHKKRKKKEKGENMAGFVGEAVFSGFIQKLVNMVASPELWKYACEEQVDSELNKWKKILMKIYAVLHDAEEKQMTNPLVKMWLHDVRDLAYDVEDILDDFATQALRRNLIVAQPQPPTGTVRSVLSYVSTSLTLSAAWSNLSMGSKIEEITARLQDISAQKRQLDLRDISAGWSGRKRLRRLPSTSLVIESRIYGRETDKAAILAMLLKDDPSDDEVCVIPIVGMGGIGKTTLAQLAFNDNKVKDHFDLRAWVCVSDDFDVLRVTKTILQSLSPHTRYANNLNLLQIELREKLYRKKFLLILDDVWNENFDEWDILCMPMRAGASGSKLIVTTRNKGVVSVTGTCSAYPLQELSYDDCLSLFTRHALGARNFDAYPHLKEVGEEIVRRCKGLPLAAKALGGMLRNQLNRRAWEDILTSKIWDLPEEKSHILPALKLSYHHLPSHLKRCFAYCSIFPKDYEFDKDELILLWMAEGFLQQTKGENQPEKLGCEYFDDLFSRSFFQQSTQNSSQFLMHDLVNDLAQSIAGDICFNLDDDKVLDDLLKEMKCLRVLSLSGYFISEMLPDSVGHLHNLQTLILRNCYRLVELPMGIGGLINLRHVDISGAVQLQEMPPQMGNLTNLQTLSDFIVGKGSRSGIKELKNLGLSTPNLRHLRIWRCVNLRSLPHQMKNLTSLHVLSIRGCPGVDYNQFMFLPHTFRGIRLVPAWLMNSFATKQRHVCILRSSKIYFSCTKPLGSLWIIKRAKDNHGRNIKILLFGLPWKVQSKIKYNQI